MSIIPDLYPFLLVVEFILATAVFASLFFIRAPYGRHTRPGWGPVVPTSYAWFFMELPAVLVITIIYFKSPADVSITSLVFLCMWETHYLYRTFLYPVLMRGSGKKFPVLVVIFAFIFNVLNGCINGGYLFQISPPYSPAWLCSPLFIAGIILFVTGFIIHIHSDHVLRMLRGRGETGYKIPRAGLHRLVASPNYFGEIVEWAGWAVATWSLPGLAFAVFTFANLVPRARAHRRWYSENFPGYPAERKVIIPWIY